MHKQTIGKGLRWLKECQQDSAQNQTNYILQLKDLRDNYLLTSEVFLTDIHRSGHNYRYETPQIVKERYDYAFSEIYPFQHAFSKELERKLDKVLLLNQNSKQEEDEN